MSHRVGWCSGNSRLELRKALGSNLDRATDCLTVGCRGVPQPFQTGGEILLDYAAAHFFSSQSVYSLKQTTAT
jgi:hypothetical protein